MYMECAIGLTEGGAPPMPLYIYTTSFYHQMVAQNLKKNIQNDKQAVKHISTTRRHFKFGPTVQQTTQIIVRYTIVNNEFITTCFN